ncbi:MAG: NAD-binding protein [Armatimonadota bacterium]|nr:NAD-binding protein [Armatimonadota bacterium]
MKIVILGCGRVGSTIASVMSREGHDVTIIDQNADAFRRLSSDFSGKTIVGNGIDEDTLRRAELDRADAFVAVTNGDNRNIMSVQLAKVRFKVPKVVARIYDPIRAAAYAELGIETVCTTCVGAGLIRDKVLGREFSTFEEYLRLGITNASMEGEHERR